MKLVVDVYGVEQACDFDTMKTEAFLVLNIFGEAVRVPITGEQMELITEKATLEHRNGTGDDDDPRPPSTDQFDETKHKMMGPPAERQEIPERSFLPMASLEGRDPLPPEDAPSSAPGFGELFEPSDEEKETKLRARNANARRPPPQHNADSAGNPVVPSAPASLPQVGNPASPSDDEGFLQG